MKWLPTRSNKPEMRRIAIEIVTIIALLIYLIATIGVNQFIRTVRDTPQLIKYIWYHEFKNPTDFKVDFYGVTYLGRSGNILDDLTLAYGAQEKPILYFLRDISKALNKPDLVFYDIGANIGQHTLFMSQIAKEVHSFEPYPPVLERLKANVDFNHLENVKIHEIGLGDRNSSMKFFKPESNDSGTGGFIPRGDWGKQTYGLLPIYKGDGWILKNHIKNPDLVKCDIEGYEKPALLGLKNTLNKSRPIIVMEITTGTEKAFKSLNDLLSTLPENYQIHVFCEWDNQTGHYKLCDADISFESLNIYNVVAYPTEKASLIPSN